MYATGRPLTDTPGPDAAGGEAGSETAEKPGRDEQADIRVHGRNAPSAYAG